VTTAADYEPELVDALNLLIEDERASVEMEVALASGATEYLERETLAGMGLDDIRSCATLRSEMERAGLPVTPQINGVVFEVLGAERYDDRLRAFAHHQRIVADRASELLESNLEGALRDALVSIVDTHQRHIEWANNRADAFAATRLLEFGPRQHVQVPESAIASSAAPEAPIAPLEPVTLPEILPVIAEETPAGEAPEAFVGEAPEAPEAPIAASEEPAPAISAERAESATLEEAEPTTPEAPEAEAPEAEEPTEPPASRQRRGRPRKSAEPAE
jgi:hypothetical protein